jgi:hypothetical protein
MIIHFTTTCILSRALALHSLFLVYGALGPDETVLEIMLGP